MVRLAELPALRVRKRLRRNRSRPDQLSTCHPGCAHAAWDSHPSLVSTAGGGAGILSGCQSLWDLERFAIRHHGVLTEALGLELRRPPSDSAFRYFFHQVDVAALCIAIRDCLHRQIRCQFQGKRKIPLVARITRSATVGISPGRCGLNRCRITSATHGMAPAGSWRCRPAAPLTANHFRTLICLSPACAPPRMRCCDRCETDGALRAATGSVTPSCTRMPTATGAMVLERWPRSGRQR